MKCCNAGLLAVLILAGGSASMAGEPSPRDSYDLNGDGRITFEELMEATGRTSGKLLKDFEPILRKGFDTLDRNHDGVLSARDFDDFREGMRRFREWIEHLLAPHRQRRPAEEQAANGMRT
ncbi:MAG: EF-hand domain-containing protein [Zetaproteobacteria bacterium]|nr:MAG: EF-hand domain-containing protein [Zetaproteobacteria bacterium]